VPQQTPFLHDLKQLNLESRIDFFTIGGNRLSVNGGSPAPYFRLEDLITREYLKTWILKGRAGRGPDKQVHPKAPGPGGTGPSSPSLEGRLPRRPSHAGGARLSCPANRSTSAKVKKRT